MPEQDEHPYVHGVLHAMHYAAGIGVPWLYAIAIVLVITMMAVANPSVDMQKNVLILWAFISFFFIYAKQKQLSNHIDKREVLGSKEARRQAFACFAPVIGLVVALFIYAATSLHYGFGEFLLICETLAAAAVILGTNWPLIFDMLKAAPIQERAEIEVGGGGHS